MLRFLNGILLGTSSSAGAADAAAGGGDGGGGGGGGDAAAAAAASAAAAAKAGGAANENFSFPTQKAFAEYLPEKFKADPNFRDIKSFDGLLESFVGARKLVGLDKGQRLALPNDNDKPEAWDAVYTALGRPEKADGYQIPKPPEGQQYSEGDKAFQSAVIPVLHKAGVTQRQLAAIVPEWNAMQAAAAAKEKETTDAAMKTSADALKTEWGGAYDTKVGDATDAAAYLDGELKLGGALTKAFERTDAAGNRLGNDPAILKMMAFYGKQMREDGLLGKGNVAGQAEFSPAEAKQQIAALEGDGAFMKSYRDKKAPGHADAVAKMKSLYEQANPPATPAA
jgi:hypothetical protein